MWQEILRLPQPELARQDFGYINLCFALGLRGSDDLDIRACIDILEEWTRRVEAETQRLLPQFRRRPEVYQNSEAYFRMMVLVTVLQRDLGAHYDERLMALDDHAFFARADHLFIHGVLSGRGGTCSSLPVVFAAVGRRLGYPLKLVTMYQHRLLRWEGAEGERFNIECTSRGLVCHPDAHYRTWPKPLTDEQVRRYGGLRSLTPDQELACFVGDRGHVCIENQLFKEAIVALLCVRPGSGQLGLVA